MRDLLHVDSLGEFRRLTRTSAGGIEVPAYLTRTGIFEYRFPDGSVVRELRHPDDVFHKDSLESLRHATVTVDHPREREVTAATWKKLSVGHLADAGRVVDDKYVASSVVVQDADVCARVANKELCEISMGYRCKYDERPGTYEGKPYDVRQVDIRYNHVALLEKGQGRAGRDVGVKLDALDASDLAVGLSEPFAYPSCMTVQNDSQGSDKPTPVTVLNAADFVNKAEHEKAVAQLQAKCDSLVIENTKLTNDLVTERARTAPVALDKLVADRSTLIAQAKSIAGADFQCDGLSEHEIRAAAIVKADSTLKLDGKSSDYVTARFDVDVERAAKASASSTQVLDVLAGKNTNADPAPKNDTADADPRAAMLKRNASAYAAAHSR